MGYARNREFGRFITDWYGDDLAYRIGGEDPVVLRGAFNPGASVTVRDSETGEEVLVHQPILKIHQDDLPDGMDAPAEGDTFDDPETGELRYVEAVMRGGLGIFKCWVSKLQGDSPD